MHDRLGGRTILCDPVGGRIPADERLEHMANARVPDDQPMCRVQKESLFMITGCFALRAFFTGTRGDTGPAPRGKRIRCRWSGEIEPDPRGPAAQLLRA